MGLDLLIPKRQAQTDESLGSFIRRRLGQEAVEKFAGPVMAGIYVADPDRLSMHSTFPNFVEMEQQHGSLIKAMQIAKKQQAASSTNGQAPTMFHSLRGGMGRLVEALLPQLKGDLRLNCQVATLRPVSPGFEITLANSNAPSFKTDAVVLAIPAYAAADLVDPLQPQLAAQLRNIRYVSTATVSLGYRRAEVLAQHPLDGFGFLIPKREQRQIIACTWTSTKFNHRAPADGVLLRSFVGGYAQEHLVNLPDETLIALVREELADIMKLTAEPVTHKIFRWEKGNPQYEVGHLERVAEIERLGEQLPGLYFAGSAYRGIGLPDCIKSALTTVDKIFKAVPEISSSP
jgi:oxygen-dependent protoporphyrinogen oxidase